MQIALWKSLLRLAFSLLLGTAAVAVQVEAASDKGSEAESKDKPTPTATPNFKPESITSTGTVTVGGSPIEYQAVAGTIVVHPKGWDDAALAGDQQSKKSEESEESEQEPNEHKNPTAEASMFYVAYNKKNVEAGQTSHHVPVQRRTRLFDSLAAHGRLWTSSG